MAFSAPLMSSMTCQIPPPLKVAGSCVSKVQISASLSFHVPSAEFKLSIIQFPAGHLPSKKCGSARHWALPWLENRKSSGDEVEDFLGKGHHEAARQGEETLRTLGRIVALEGKTDLHHTPAQEDEADGADQGKDEGREVLTTPSGSLAAKAVVEKQQAHSTTAT